MIDVPRKVSRSRIKSEFKSELIYNDVDEGYFVLEQLGYTIFRVQAWEPGIRKDVISFDSNSHSDELKKLNIGSNVPDEAKEVIQLLVIAFWDVFTKDGLRRPMLGYEF